MSNYDELEVSPKASQETIRAAYQSLVKRFHPDRNPGDQAAADRTKRVNVAYQTLSDPEARKRYDQELRAKGNASAQAEAASRQHAEEAAREQTRSQRERAEPTSRAEAEADARQYAEAAARNQAKATARARRQAEGDARARQQTAEAAYKRQAKAKADARNDDPDVVLTEDAAREQTGAAELERQAKAYAAIRQEAEAAARERTKVTRTRNWVLVAAMSVAILWAYFENNRTPESPTIVTRPTMPPTAPVAASAGPNAAKQSPVQPVQPGALKPQAPPSARPLPRQQAPVQSSNAASSDVREPTSPLGRFASLHAAMERGTTDDVDYMVKHGANVNERNRGFTPLTIAVRLSDYRAAEILLSAGADPNATDSKGQSVLVDAFARNDQKMFDLLQRYGAKK